MKKNKQVIPGESIFHSITPGPGDRIIAGGFGAVLEHGIAVDRKPADLKDTEYGNRKVHAIGATARRVVTGFELDGQGFTIVSEPGVAAARRPTPIRDAGESDFNPEVLRNGSGALDLKTIDDLITKGSNPELAEKMRAYIVDMVSPRNIGEMEPSNPILGYPLASEARTEMMKLLLSPGLVLVGTPSIIHMTPEFLANLEHRVEYGALEEYVHKTTKNFRRTSKAMAKEMRKSSKRFIKKVAKLK